METQTLTAEQIAWLDKAQRLQVIIDTLRNALQFYASGNNYFVREDDEIALTDHGETADIAIEVLDKWEAEYANNN